MGSKTISDVDKFKEEKKIGGRKQSEDYFYKKPNIVPRNYREM